MIAGFHGPSMSSFLEASTARHVVEDVVLVVHLESKFSQKGREKKQPGSL